VKKKITKRERNKIQEKQAMQMKNNCSPPPTDDQLVPKQQPLPAAQLPPVYTMSMLSYGKEYPFGCFGSAVLAVPPAPASCAPPAFSLAGNENLGSP